MASAVGYQYLNVTSIPQELICLLCWQPLRDPVHIPCPHDNRAFCRSCIEEYISAHSSCPKCPRRLDKTDLITPDNDSLSEKLKQIPVQCLCCKGKNLTRGAFGAHYPGECPDVIVTCPANDVNCSWKGKRAELDAHRKNCSLHYIRGIALLVVGGGVSGQQLREEVAELRRENEELKRRVADLEECVTKLPEALKTVEELQALVANHDHGMLNAELQPNNDRDVRENNETDVIHNSVTIPNATNDVRVSLSSLSTEQTSVENDADQIFESEFSVNSLFPTPFCLRDKAQRQLSLLFAFVT